MNSHCLNLKVLVMIFSISAALSFHLSSYKPAVIIENKYSLGVKTS